MLDEIFATNFCLFFKFGGGAACRVRTSRGGQTRHSTSRTTRRRVPADRTRPCAVSVRRVRAPCPRAVSARRVRLAPRGAGRRARPAPAPAELLTRPRAPQVPPNEDDTELLLCLLAEVEEQISESRACVHGASNKLEESKEFEAASAERQKEAQLSEATRRKLQRRAQIIHAEVKSELAKAVAQLRHSSHHYKHVKGEVERALRQRDRRVMDYARAEGRAEALSSEIGQNKELMQRLHQEKEDAEVKARRLQDEVDEQRKARTLAETHARTLSATLEQEEEALRHQQAAGSNLTEQNASLEAELQQTRASLEAAEASNKQLTKSRDLLVAQLKNSKEVVARITADNLMFLNKIKHCETKLEQAVKEREVVPPADRDLFVCSWLPSDTHQPRHLLLLLCVWK